MRYAQLIITVSDKIVDVYEQNANTKSRGRAMVLQEMSLISESTLIRGTIAYMLVGMLHFINPIYGYFWQAELKPLVPLYIPFVDEKTALGFISLLLIQSFQLFVGLVSSACADFPFLIVAMNIWAFSTIFAEYVIDLNDVIEHAENANMPLIKTKLQRIIEMHNDNWT